MCTYLVYLYEVPVISAEFCFRMYVLFLLYVMESSRRISEASRPAERGSASGQQPLQEGKFIVFVQCGRAQLRLLVAERVALRIFHDLAGVDLLRRS